MKTITLKIKFPYWLIQATEDHFECDKQIKIEDVIVDLVEAKMREVNLQYCQRSEELYGEKNEKEN